MGKYVFLIFLPILLCLKCYIVHSWNEEPLKPLWFLFFRFICKWSPRKSENTKGVKTMLTTMNVILQHPGSCLALDSSAEFFSPWLMQAGSSAHPLVPWLTCAPLELCPLLLNIQRQILQMDLSYISSLLYFQVLNLHCSQDTVKYTQVDFQNLLQ